MHTNRFLVSTVLSGAVLSGLAGCASTAATPEALSEGLTVLEAHEGAISLAFRRDDVVIYMEALRGHATPAEVAADPSMPAFEIDARFTDEDGHVFYSQQGGDDWVDAEWPAALERQVTDLPDATENRVLFELAGEAAQVMRVEVREQLGDEMADAVSPEVESMFAFAVQAPDVYAREWDHITDELQLGGLELPTVEVQGGEITYGTNGPEDAEYTFGTAGYYYIAVHEAGIDSTLGVGRHSATVQYRWTGSAWAHAHTNCNHGTCATSMSASCVLNYTEAVSDYHPAWTAHTCNTPYDFDSDGGGHNCHDDSRVQQHNFVYGSNFPRNAYWCNGSDDSSDISHWTMGDNSGAPTCSGRSDVSYHHPSMCLYNHNSSCPDSWRGDNECDCGCTFSDGTHADPDCD